MKKCSEEHGVHMAVCHEARLVHSRFLPAAKRTRVDAPCAGARVRTRSSRLVHGQVSHKVRTRYAQGTHKVRIRFSDHHPRIKSRTLKTHKGRCYRPDTKTHKARTRSERIWFGNKDPGELPYTHIYIYNIDINIQIECGIDIRTLTSHQVVYL